MSANIYDSTAKKLIPFAGNSEATAGSLDGLSDVNISSPTDGQVLTYDAGNQVWVNGEGATVIESLGDIEDVDLTNLQDGQSIIWDSTYQKWINYTPTTYTAGHGISIDNGVISDKTFVGTTAQWEALTPAQQALYEERVLTDDEPDVQQKTNGHTIKDEDGVSKTQRSNLQFEGLDVTDDDVNDKTIVSAEALQTAISTLESDLSAVDERVTAIEENYQEEMLYHNIPRLVPKDITAYITDGSFWDRLNGTNGYSLFEDIYVGDYIHMSRPISAYEQTQTYQTTGSQYVTIAGLDTRRGDGDGGDSISVVNYHHAVMVPGQGFGGTQHFGRSRMNSTNTTANGYVSSEMFVTTIGAVTTSGSTATTASINQQLYAEFGSHLKTTRELLTNAMDSTRYNRFGQAGGASSYWAWTSCQAVLMSEVECYGSIVWSSSGYDTGNANAQLPLFRHNKQAMNNRSAYYWLKDVASSAGFCLCYSNGFSSYGDASYASAYVRPRFILA